jgi:hypothetical protein
MKLRKAPAREGLAWARSGLVILRRQPLAQMGMVAAMGLALGLVASLPRVGFALSLVLLPALSAGWVFSSAAVQAGVRTSPARLVAALIRPRRAAMLQLGLFHMGACLLVLLLADQFDPGFRGAVSPLLGGGEGTPSAADEAATAQALEQFRNGLILRGLMLLPVALAFWHAPVIVHRVGGSAARALFVSALTSWRNLPAFSIYGLAWVAADVALSSVVSLVALLLGPLAMLAIFPAAMAFGAAFYASLYATVHGCIDFDELRRPPAAEAGASSGPAPEADPSARSEGPPADPGR